VNHRVIYVDWFQSLHFVLCIEDFVANLHWRFYKWRVRVHLGIDLKLELSDFIVDSWKQGNLTLRRQSRCGPTWSNGGKSMVPIQLWRWVIRSENIPNLFFGWSCLNWSSVHFSFLESVCSYNTRFGFLSFSLGFWVQWVGRSHAILSTWLSWCW
jgi:hypothetical protein